ncbi:MAG: hypothetical protein ABL876_07000 [Chitinophagaceae bacterium]
MKKTLLVFSIAAITFSCHKPDQNADNGNNGNGNGNAGDPDHTTIPAPANVNTEINGFVTNDQNQLLTGPNLFHLISGNSSIGAYTLMGNGMFTTSTISTDKYRTRTLVETGGGWNYMNTEQTYALTPSSKNYVRIKVLNRVSIGSVKNKLGGVFPFSNGGSITYGINTFYQTATVGYPGFFSPEMVSGIYLSCLDPENKDFALKLPSYLAGDDAGERWFLKSYGAITFKMITDGLTGDNVDFYNGGSAELKLPIPAGMQAEAPDSVNAWQLVNGNWSKSGWAKRQGNFYTARVGKVAAWTFAQPVKGVYLTVNLRTDSSATLINTAVRIRMAGRVIAESRTDADGNAIFFVPTHENLSAEVVPDERMFSPNTYTYPIGQVTKSSTVTVKMPNNTPELSTIIANVYNCNGEPVVSGTARIMNDLFGIDYYVPVKNGRFATALWVYGTNNAVRVQVTDNATGSQGDLTRLVLFYGDVQRVNVYSCMNSSLLFCNFSIDNTVYEVKDNASSPNVFLTASRAGAFGPVTIRTTPSNVGVNFTTTAIFMVTVTSGLVTDLVINGVPYNYDPSIQPVISTTRFDPVMNGYLEGCIILYYKDNANVQHRLAMNYKVKRTF